MIELAADPVDEPKALKALALSLHLYGLREFTDDNVNRLGQLDAEAVGDERARSRLRHLEVSLMVEFPPSNQHLGEGKRDPINLW